LFSSDRIHNQERRASARRGSNSRLQRRLLLWTDYVSPRTFASHTTAGSRQPLLLREARSVRNARFAIHQRTSARAAGDRPPWCNRSNVARNCIANGRVRTTRFPRGADAPRSCVGVRTFAGGTATFAVHKRTCTRAAGDRPPWCNRSNVARNRIGNGRVRTIRLPRSAYARLLLIAQTFAIADRCLRLEKTCRDYPRGADAPRSCVGVRTFVGGTATFAMHKRTSARAAGVSPPWFGDANAVPRASYIVQQRPNTQSRAAGVSPPWLKLRTVCEKDRVIFGNCRRQNQGRRGDCRRAWRQLQRRGFFPSENGRISCVARKCVCRHHTGFFRTKTVAFHAIGPHLHVVEKMSFPERKRSRFMAN
jgi:hypothetical protein